MERRSKDRKETDFAAMCRVPATPHAARVLDLSRGGCRLSVPHAPTSPGVSVSVALGPDIEARGVVVWSRGIEAGIRFSPALGAAAAVALGLEEASPEPAPAYEPVDERARGLLPHWFRQLAGGLIPGGRKATLFVR